MRNHLCCSALILLAVFGCGGTAAVRCGGRCVCLQCPAGQEPSKPCEQLQNPAEDVQCQSCPSGSFSDALDAELCRPHTSCEMLGRKVAVSGTVSSDVVCSDCLPGFHPSAKGQISTQSSCVKDSRVRAVRTVDNGPATGAGGPSNSTVVRSAGEKTEYAVFALVPVFCIMGLMGILICNILKKKGYNCTAEKEGGDEEMATPQKEGNSCPYISDDLNEDTISVLVRLITEKKENAEALEELLLEYESKQMSKGSSIKLPMLSPLSTFRSLPRLCPHHSHLHTISGLSGLAPRHGYRCSRCAQKKWPPVLIPPLDSLKDPLKPPQRLLLPSFDTPTDQLKNPLLGGMCVDTHHMQTAVPKTVQDKVDKGAEKEKKEGELTVLSVGRFQVAHIPENKPATLETKTSYQEKRSSLFAGKHFSSSSSLSSAFRR